jgi:hypothetical protein
MSGRIPARCARLIVVVLATAAAFALAAGAASAEVIYNNIPSPLPGNFVSYGNEAYSMSELGGQVEFAGTARKNPTVTVGMSSWACERGNWVDQNCESGLAKVQAFFKEPVTFKIYEVGPENSVGALITQRTKTFKMPYRPSGSPKCPGGTWFDAANSTCYHGKAFTISLKLKTKELPAKAIVSVSYNTSHYGPHPFGDKGCEKTTQGCPYDSLNIAISEPSEGTLSLGADPTENLYVNSNYNEMYCGSSATLNVFGPTGTCYAGDQPVIEVKAE